MRFEPRGGDGNAGGFEPVEPDTDMWPMASSEVRSAPSSSARGWVRNDRRDFPPKQGVGLRGAAERRFEIEPRKSSRSPASKNSRRGPAVAAGGTRFPDRASFYSALAESDVDGAVAPTDERVLFRGKKGRRLKNREALAVSPTTSTSRARMSHAMMGAGSKGRRVRLRDGGENYRCLASLASLDSVGILLQFLGRCGQP